MELNSFFAQIKNYIIDDIKVDKVEKIYGTILPESVKKLISFMNEPIFIDKYRVISYSEIINAEDDLHVSFVKEGIIPLVDCMDNDFIVYDFVNNIWMKYNIVDKCRFNKQKFLEVLMC